MISSLALVVGLAVSPPPPPSQVKVAAPASLSADEQVLFAEAEEALKRFEAMRIEVPKGGDMVAWSQAFSQGVQASSQAMADLQTRYARLSASSRPEIAIPAQVRAGEVLEKFASDFEQLPLPDGLEPQAHKAVAQAVLQGAQSMRDGARQYYQMAVNRAQALGFQGDWVDFARTRVAAMGKAPMNIAVPPAAPESIATEPEKGREHPPIRR